MYFTIRVFVTSSMTHSITISGLQNAADVYNSAAGRVELISPAGTVLRYK